MTVKPKEKMITPSHNTFLNGHILKYSWNFNFLLLLN